MARALRRGHRRAPSCTRRSTRTPIDVIVDKGQDPTPRATAASRAPTLAELLRERGIDRGHGRRAGDRLLRQEHRARRAARGLRGHGRQHRRARRRRRSRATPSARSTELRAAGRRRVGPLSDARATRLLAQLRPHVADERVLGGDARRPARALRARRDLRRRGVGQRRRCRSAAGQTISQPLVVARMCELLELRGRRARARRRHRLGLPRRACWRGSARTCGAIERHAALSRAGAAQPRGRGRDERHARRRRRRARPARARAPYDAINVAAAAGAACPQALPAQLARRRAAGRARSTTATSGSCVVRRTAGAELERTRARARALRAAGQP